MPGSEIRIAVAGFESGAILASRRLNDRPDRYRGTPQHARSQAAWQLVADLLEEALGAACPAELCVRQDALERPWLLGVEGVDVNLSHGGQWLAAGVSRVGRIGVDVEVVRPVDDALPARCCTASELTWLRRGTPQEGWSRLFRLWTLKEAWLKATGLGLRVDPRAVPIALDGATARLHPDHPQAAQWHLLSVELAPGVWLGACTQGAALQAADVERRTLRWVGRPAVNGSE